EGIADLRSWTRRFDFGGAKSSDAEARAARERVAAKPNRDGDVVGGVSDRGHSESRGARGPSGTGEAGANARSGRAGRKERPARRPPAQQGVVADGSAVGAYPLASVTRAQVDAGSAGRAGRDAEESLQQRPRVDAHATVADSRMQAQDAAGSP